MADATGSAHYQGPRANAGIILELQGGGEVMRADSFEGESSNLGFNASASTSFVLTPGSRRIVGASVNPLGAGGEARNKDAQVTLHVLALDLSSAIGPVHA